MPIFLAYNVPFPLPFPWCSDAAYSQLSVEQHKTRAAGSRKGEEGWFVRTSLLGQAIAKMGRGGDLEGRGEAPYETEQWWMLQLIVWV